MFFLSEKSKKQKAIWIGLAIAFGIVIILCITILPFALFGYFVSSTVDELTDDFGYSNEDMIAYVDEKYGVEVTVIDNPGRDPKGLTVEDTLVRTVDDEVEFYIQINPFGKISGGTYEEVKQKFDLNRKYENSELFNELQALRFKEITFGESLDDPPLHLSLPDEPKNS